MADTQDTNIPALKREKAQLQRGIVVAQKMISNYELRIESIDSQLQELEGHIAPEDPENVIKAKIPALFSDEMLSGASNELSLRPKMPPVARRGALSAKEKMRQYEEEQAEKAKAQESAPPSRAPSSRPTRPLRPGEKPQQDPSQMPPELRKEWLIQKLVQRDPRQMREGLLELDKPYNKTLKPQLLKDPKFLKLYKNAQEQVGKYEKICMSMKKNLKIMMQSSSDVVKSRMEDLKKGRIGQGIAGLKEISDSSSWGNEIGEAAHKIVNDVKDLYRMFDIKPEQAITKELLEEARPILTAQTTEKSNADKDVDTRSRQNMIWGETKEITDEDKRALNEIKKITGTDELPPLEKKEDMKRVKEIIIAIALSESKENKALKAAQMAAAAAQR